MECPTAEGRCIAPALDCEICTYSSQFRKFKDRYKPEPKRIKVETGDFLTVHTSHVHITHELYNAMKKLHPDGI